MLEVVVKVEKNKEMCDTMRCFEAKLTSNIWQDPKIEPVGCDTGDANDQNAVVFVFWNVKVCKHHGSFNELGPVHSRSVFSPI